MGRGWFDDIYEEIMSEWRNYIIDNSDEKEEEVDENELLEDFKSSNVNINFNLEEVDAIDLLEIQKYLIDRGVNYQYLFDIVDIERYIVEKVLDEFEG